MVTWCGTCDGCRRTGPSMRPAPGTPDDDICGNLYCEDCTAAGRAVYRARRPPHPLAMFLTLVVDTVILVVMTLGLLSLASAIRAGIMAFLK